MQWIEGGLTRRSAGRAAMDALAPLVLTALLAALPGTLAAQAKPSSAPAAASPAHGQPAAPATAAAPSSTKPPAKTSPAPSPAQAPAAEHPEPPVRPVRFVVVLNPAHGGADGGARLSSQLYEKDLVLTLAERLRIALTAHSIPVIMVRISDVDVPVLNRAQMTDHARAAACITLHATTSGSGVHLFTSSLTEIPITSFLPWETAQGAYTTQSLRLSSEIGTVMRRDNIPVTQGRTALQPLDSFTCPAVAVEVAPLIHSGTATPLSDPAYQNRLVNALAAAIEQWQQDWKKVP